MFIVQSKNFNTSMLKSSKAHWWCFQVRWIYYTKLFLHSQTNHSLKDFQFCFKNAVLKWNLRKRICEISFHWMKRKKIGQRSCYRSRIVMSVFPLPKWTAKAFEILPKFTPRLHSTLSRILIFHHNFSFCTICHFLAIAKTLPIKIG